MEEFPTQLCANRDQATILVLLDTGLRATKLCSLTVNDVGLTTRWIVIQHGVAIGSKASTVFPGKVDRKAGWLIFIGVGLGSKPISPCTVVHLHEIID
jgi:integrase/recombinase XerD